LIRFDQQHELADPGMAETDRSVLSAVYFPGFCNWGGVSGVLGVDFS